MTLPYKRHDFRKKSFKLKCVFFIFSTILSKIFFFLRRIQRDIVINMKTSSRKLPVILVGFKGNLNFVDRCSKTYISNYMKIRPVGVELLIQDGRTAKLADAFLNFYKALKNCLKLNLPHSAQN